MEEQDRRGESRLHVAVRKSEGEGETKTVYKVETGRKRRIRQLHQKNSGRNAIATRATGYEDLG